VVFEEGLFEVVFGLGGPFLVTGEVGDHCAVGELLLFGLEVPLPPRVIHPLGHKLRSKLWAPIRFSGKGVMAILVVRFCSLVHLTYLQR
jgi:hypothetical protein